jgi:hypothetical protein
MLKIVKVENKKQLDDFINFQYEIYKDSEHFVPPLKMDRYKLINPEKNPFFKENDSAFYLCYEDNKIVGRVAAIENKRYNDYHDDNAGFFGFFESINNVEVAKLLIQTAKDWNIKKGRSKIYGPVNPHLNDDSPGFLVKGFDDDPVMLLAYTHEYYLNLMDQIGLKKAKDLHSFWVEAQGVKNIDKMERIIEKSKKRHNITIRPINMKNFETEYLIIQDIFNKAWEKNWGQIPLTNEDFEYIASDLKSLVHTDFLQLAFKDDIPIGMTVSFPDVNEMIKPMKGSLITLKALPFIKYILTKKVNVKRIRIFILGILPEYDHTGATAALYLQTTLAARKHGVIGGEMAWILEDNDKMIKAAEMLGGQLVKTYRIFEDKLN